MANGQQDIDFSVNKDNLYREEAVTDMKVASIRRLLPIKTDGTDDPGRTPIFMGQTQLMTPEGAVPIQSMLKASTLEEAIEDFPRAMEVALQDMVQKMQQLHQQRQQQQKKDESRIIVPGR